MNKQNSELYILKHNDLDLVAYLTNRWCQSARNRYRCLQKIRPLLLLANISIYYQEDTTSVKNLVNERNEV